MTRIVTTLIVLLLCVVLLNIAISGTKPRVLSDNRTVTLDAMFGDVFRVIPIVTSQNVYIETSNPFYYELPYDYGDPSNYAVVMTCNTGKTFGILAVSTVERIAGDSIKITKYTGYETDTATVSILTVPIGIWGK